MRFDINKLLVGVFTFGVILLILNIIYTNLNVINSSFTKEIPVGTILLIIFGIGLLYHLQKVIRFYTICIEYKRIDYLILNICVYIIITSVVLSINYSFEPSYGSVGTHKTVYISPPPIYSPINPSPYVEEQKQYDYKYTIKTIDDSGRRKI